MDLQIENVDMEVDVTKIIESLMERHKMIFRDLTVPLIVGFQDEQNRATAQASLHQWTESVLKDRRNELRNVIEEQYYKPMLKAILQRRKDETDKYIETQPEIPSQTEEPAKLGAQVQQQQSPLTTQLDNGTSQISNVNDVVNETKGIDIENPPFRVKMVYDDIILDTFVEKADAVTKMFDSGLLTEEMAVEKAGLDDLVEKVKIAKQNGELKPKKQPTFFDSSSMR
jgi:hypothetical protein